MPNVVKLLHKKQLKNTRKTWFRNLTALQALATTTREVPTTIIGVVAPFSLTIILTRGEEAIPITTTIIVVLTIIRGGKTRTRTEITETIITAVIVKDKDITTTVTAIMETTAITTTISVITVIRIAIIAVLLAIAHMVTDPLLIRAGTWIMIVNPSTKVVIGVKGTVIIAETITTAMRTTTEALCLKEIILSEVPSTPATLGIVIDLITVALQVTLVIVTAQMIAHLVSITTIIVIDLGKEKTISTLTTLNILKVLLLKDMVVIKISRLTGKELVSTTTIGLTTITATMRVMVVIGQWEVTMAQSEDLICVQEAEVGLLLATINDDLWGRLITLSSHRGFDFLL